MTKKARKTYRKPEIAQVRLVPEEAVLAGCKTPTIVGPEFSGYCATGACKDARS